MKNDYLSRAGLTFLIMLTIVLSVIYIKGLADRELKVVFIQDPNYVQNIGEAQMRLKEQGLYNGKIDYIWGPLMDEAYGNYCAIETIEGR